MEKLLDMLSYRRNAGSKGEEKFIAKYIDSVEGMRTDDFGNRYVVIGPHQHPTTMFSSHTDSVHRKGGSSRQRVVYDPYIGDAYLPDADPADRRRCKISGQELSTKHAESNCLGADDAAGVYIMLELIAEGVEGLYVFHRQEECGGWGSDHFANRQEDKLLRGIQRCVAFDRKGLSSIITHQAGGRCCSDKFAQALGQAMDDFDITWKLDDTGLFTDSANYTHIIPECTNLSVGYFDEHTESECLNVAFVEELIMALIWVRWDQLPTVRDPAVEEIWGWDKCNNTTSKGWNETKDFAEQVDYSKTFRTWDDAYDLARGCPEQAADLLMAYCGVEREDGAEWL